MKYSVLINVEIHSVTCPGVCLCSSSDIELSIKCLHYLFRTFPRPARFPIILHEIFTIKGFYTNDFSHLDDFEQVLSNEPIELQLWQKGRRLAHFNGIINDLLKPHVLRKCNRLSENRFFTDILLNPSKCFPGIIGPKCTIALQLNIMERINEHDTSPIAKPIACKSINYCQYNGLPTYRSHCDQCCKNEAKKCRRYQKPVCHIRDRAKKITNNCCCNRNSAYCKPTTKKLSHRMDNNLIPCNCLSCTPQYRQLNETNRSDGKFVYELTSPDDHSNYITYDTNHQFTMDHKNRMCEICDNYRRIFKL